MPGMRGKVPAGLSVRRHDQVLSEVNCVVVDGVLEYLKVLNPVHTD